MRQSRFTTEQIVAVLHEHEAGATISELARQHGITETTFHRSRKRYGGLQLSEAKRLTALEEERRQLTPLAVDQALTLQVVKDLLGQRVAPPERRRPAVMQVMDSAGITE